MVISTNERSSWVFLFELNMTSWGLRVSRLEELNLLRCGYYYLRLSMGDVAIGVGIKHPSSKIFVVT